MGKARSPTPSRPNERRVTHETQDHHLIRVDEWGAAWSVVSRQSLSRAPSPPRRSCIFVECVERAWYERSAEAQRRNRP